MVERSSASPARNVARLLLGLTLCKALASLGVVASGFSAISDDDYARVVIAQRFAAHPALDPSGTSWLPFPFWLSGSTLMLFGSTLDVARAVAWITSLLSPWVLYAAARCLGIERRWAALGSLVASLLPHSLWLGLATVPEGYTAALSLFAAASLVDLRPSHRWLGALALLVGTLSRYETWPLAAAYLAITGSDVWRRKLPLSCMGCLLIAGFGPLWWMTQGWVEHGDPIFFVERVAAYRRALEATLPHAAGSALLAKLLRYPLVLVRGEPELSAVFLVSAAWVLHGRLRLQGSYLRPFAVAAFQIIGLIAGDLGDGSPTHHPERPLLFPWLLAALFAVDATRAVLLSNGRWARFLGALAPVLASIVALRSWITQRDAFVDRTNEVDIGRRASPLIASGSGVVAIDTDDYGYFAIQAGLGAPERSAILRAHDPRDPASTALASSPEALKATLERLGAHWLIVGARHEALARQVGSIRLQSPDFLLAAITDESSK